MAKKRSCRRTEDENRIHEKAVKMRKMTDAQLNKFLEDETTKAFCSGFEQGRASVPKIDIPSILEEISRIKGIGEVKLSMIKAILESKLKS